EKQKDNSLAKGKEKVISEGKPGKVIKEFEVTLENGEEVDRELVSEEVEKAAENRIVVLGTKEPKPAGNLVTLSSSNQSAPASSGKTLQMSATAYSIDCVGCDGRGFTAT